MLAPIAAELLEMLRIIRAFPNRLLYPRLHGQQVGWDTALDEMATQFSQTIAETGPESVSFYVSGQLLTEDYLWRTN